MGLFSKIFGGGKKSSGIVSGKNPGKGWIEANRFNKARGGFAGGYGAITFGNIINADSSPDDIVGEFGLDQQDAEYGDCYQRAYDEAYQKASFEAEMINALEGMFGEEVDTEDLIDYEEVEENAYNYAIELAESWIDGGEWIPDDVLDWAYYDVSDHNG